MQNIKTRLRMVTWVLLGNLLQYLFPYVCFAYNSLPGSFGYIMVVYFDI